MAFATVWIIGTEQRTGREDRFKTIRASCTSTDRVSKPAPQDSRYS
jgi:hypothetical protein